MRRRDILKALVLTATGLSATKAIAATSNGAPDANKLPFKRVSVKEDASKVVFFFDFGCQFSANYHIPMMNWERTLPRSSRLSPVTVEYIPVINANDDRRKREMTYGAAGFYAALSKCKDTAQLKTFIEAVYDARLRDGIPLTSRNAWLYACKKAGLQPTSYFASAAAVQKSLLISSAERLVKYKVTTTPTAGVGGQFTLTPDEVSGDSEMFFNVLSGLTSNYLLG